MYAFKHANRGCAYDLTRSFRTPFKTKNPSIAWGEMVPTNTFPQ